MADVVANPDSGAAGTEYQTVEALRRLGHDVDTVWADSLPHRVTHGNLHYLLELPRAYRKAMLERMQATRYDVVHANQPHGYLAASALRQRKEKAVFVHRSHGLELRVKRTLEYWRKEFDAEDSRSWGRSQASRVIDALLARHSWAIARYADGHIVSASDCRRFLIEELGVPAERVALIPQAAPLDYVSTPAPAMSPDRHLRVLHVGQYAYFKAPMVVAAILNRIFELDDRVTATWVTAGTAHSQVRALLREPARARVTLVDWMSQDRLKAIYDRHGIFLFPSFFEGFGKVFLEAMSRGLCVVAADNSGARDVISHGKDGFLVPTGDLVQMTRTCVALLKSTESMQAISRLAAARAHEFSWDRVARESAAFYEVLLKAKDRCLAGF